MCMINLQHLYLVVACILNKDAFEFWLTTSEEINPPIAIVIFMILWETRNLIGFCFVLFYIRSLDTDIVVVKNENVIRCNVIHCVHDRVCLSKCFRYAVDQNIIYRSTMLS